MIADEPLKPLPLNPCPQMSALTSWGIGAGASKQYVVNRFGRTTWEW